MNKKLFPIFLIVLVDVFGLMLITPMLPLYAEKMGATPLIASLLFSSYAAFQLIAGPILGQISDRVGRKPVLLLSQVGTLIGFIMLGVSNTLVWVFISRIIDGATAGNISVATAYISDVTEPHERARSFGWIGVSFATGFVIGPALSGFLAAHGPHVPIYGAILASTLSIAATAFLLPGRDPSTQTVKAGEQEALINPAAYALALKNRPLATLLLQFVLFSLAFSGFFTGFALYGERRYFYHGIPLHVREIGFALAVMGLSALPVQIFILPRALKRFGEIRLVTFGFVGITIGYILLAIPALPALVASLMVLGGSSSLLRPSLFSLITHQVGRDKQGMIMGLTQSLMSVCQIVAPIYGGWIIGMGWLDVWPLVPMTFCFAGWMVGRIGPKPQTAMAGHA